MDNGGQRGSGGSSWITLGLHGPPVVVFQILPAVEREEGARDRSLEFRSPDGYRVNLNRRGVNNEQRRSSRATMAIRSLPMDPLAAAVSLGPIEYRKQKPDFDPRATPSPHGCEAAAGASTSHCQVFPEPVQRAPVQLIQVIRSDHVLSALGHDPGKANAGFSLSCSM